jgi:hypothetical protein
MSKRRKNALFIKGLKSMKCKTEEKFNEKKNRKT